MSSKNNPCFHFKYGFTSSEINFPELEDFQIVN